MLAVSNSGDASVGIFDFRTQARALPAIAVRELVHDASVLKYAHGAAFAQRDEVLISLGEHSQALGTIKVGRRLEQIPNPRVIRARSGCDDGLDNPADIAIHPEGNWCVIANRKFTGLSFFSLDGDLEETPPKFQANIDVGVMNQLGIAAPHGVSFSATGGRMFVTHKRFTGWGYGGDKGRSGVSVWQVGQACPASLEDHFLVFEDFDDAHLHHVTCHPRLSYVAITNSRGAIEVLRWEERSNELTRIDSIDVFRFGEGAKGVAFTPDGRFIAVSTELSEILFFPFRCEAHGAAVPLPVAAAGALDE